MIPHMRSQFLIMHLYPVFSCSFPVMESHVLVSDSRQSDSHTLHLPHNTKVLCSGVSSTFLPT